MSRCVLSKIDKLHRGLHVPLPTTLTTCRSALFSDSSSNGAVFDTRSILNKDLLRNKACTLSIRYSSVPGCGSRDRHSVSAPQDHRLHHDCPGLHLTSENHSIYVNCLADLSEVPTHLRAHCRITYPTQAFRSRFACARLIRPYTA